MRRFIVALFVTLVLGACATAPTTSGGYETALKQWTAAKDRAEYRIYGRSFVEAQNAQHIDDGSGCYQKGRGVVVQLLLMVDGNGKIEATHADNNSEKAKCFKAAYLGAQMPIPPFSPFPMPLKMN